MEDLKQENESLKSDLRNKCLEIRFLENKFCDVTNYSVHVLTKPLYSSFFKKKHQNESAKIQPKKPTETKYTENKSGSSFDKDLLEKEVAKQLKPFYDKQNKFNKSVAQAINKHTDQITGCGAAIRGIGDYLERDLKSDVCTQMYNMLVENRVIKVDNSVSISSNEANNSRSDTTEDLSVNNELKKKQDKKKAFDNCYEQATNDYLEFDYE
jgi:hypothetical protein